MHKDSAEQLQYEFVPVAYLVIAVCDCEADSMMLFVEVKLRGFRTELTEVDHHLSTFPGVKQALYIMHKDRADQQHYGIVPVAYLVITVCDC